MQESVAQSRYTHAPAASLKVFKNPPAPKHLASELTTTLLSSSIFPNSYHVKDMIEYTNYIRTHNKILCSDSTRYPLDLVRVTFAAQYLRGNVN